ncbi:hypothetical protein K493DRAFT_63995 [Basidiobolus meristosporus CBS 931.73]|uniref:Chromo domain-containing protein n=1 Tax=Basidiobolus meristosporus CBS 931.73 TaxID=1314790 RepID=A0A1Y1XVZ5_9FUNG|nr:hypothetical protein K493DRAFT_63995 [Basidiobolus meristosporus CBS 931.73]|eukprot:ORX89927.1 hypothetical protein K493DRAFT_63995 [Basidiobolus meristosporus CBS 931.73]
MTQSQQTGSEELDFYDRPAIIAHFESIQPSLLQELRETHPNVEVDFTPQDLSRLTGQLQKLQNDLLGKTSVRTELHCPKIPARFFQPTQPLQPDSALHHILKGAFQFRFANNWSDWGFDRAEKRETLLGLILYIRDVLVRSELLHTPRIYLGEAIELQLKEELSSLVTLMKG